MLFHTTAWRQRKRPADYPSELLEVILIDDGSSDRTWALIDGYVLGKPVVWVKTERGREPAAGVDLSRGRA